MLRNDCFCAITVVNVVLAEKIKTHCLLLAKNRDKNIYLIAIYAEEIFTCKQAVDKVFESYTCKPIKVASSSCVQLTEITFELDSHVPPIFTSCRS